MLQIITLEQIYYSPNSTVRHNVSSSSWREFFGGFIQNRLESHLKKTQRKKRFSEVGKSLKRETHKIETEDVSGKAIGMLQ